LILSNSGSSGGDLFNKEKWDLRGEAASNK